MLIEIILTFLVLVAFAVQMAIMSDEDWASLPTLVVHTICAIVYPITAIYVFVVVGYRVGDFQGLPFGLVLITLAATALTLLPFYHLYKWVDYSRSEPAYTH